MLFVSFVGKMKRVTVLPCFGICLLNTQVTNGMTVADDSALESRVCSIGVWWALQNGFPLSGKLRGLPTFTTVFKCQTYCILYVRSRIVSVLTFWILIQLKCTRLDMQNSCDVNSCDGDILALFQKNQSLVGLSLFPSYFVADLLSQRWRWLAFAISA